jgi:hypothetical protein
MEQAIHTAGELAGSDPNLNPLYTEVYNLCRRINDKATRSEFENFVIANKLGRNHQFPHTEKHEREESLRRLVGTLQFLERSLNDRIQARKSISINVLKSNEIGPGQVNLDPRFSLNSVQSQDAQDLRNRMEAMYANMRGFEDRFKQENNGSGNQGIQGLTAANAQYSGAAASDLNSMYSDSRRSSVAASSFLHSAMGQSEMGGREDNRNKVNSFMDNMAQLQYKLKGQTTSNAAEEWMERSMRSSVASAGPSQWDRSEMGIARSEAPTPEEQKAKLENFIGGVQQFQGQLQGGGVHLNGRDWQEVSMQGSEPSVGASGWDDSVAAAPVQTTSYENEKGKVDTFMNNMTQLQGKLEGQTTSNAAQANWYEQSIKGSELSAEPSGWDQSAQNTDRMMNDEEEKKQIDSFMRSIQQLKALLLEPQNQQNFATQSERVSAQGSASHWSANTGAIADMDNERRLQSFKDNLANLRNIMADKGGKRSSLFSMMSMAHSEHPALTDLSLLHSLNPEENIDNEENKIKLHSFLNQLESLKSRFDAQRGERRNSVKSVVSMHQSDIADEVEYHQTVVREKDPQGGERIVTTTQEVHRILQVNDHPGEDEAARNAQNPPDVTTPDHLPLNPPSAYSMEKRESINVGSVRQPLLNNLQSNAQRGSISGQPQQTVQSEHSLGSGFSATKTTETQRIAMQNDIDRMYNYMGGLNHQLQSTPHRGSMAPSDYRPSVQAAAHDPQDAAQPFQTPQAPPSPPRPPAINESFDFTRPPQAYNSAEPVSASKRALPLRLDMDRVNDAKSDGVAEGMGKIRPKTTKHGKVSGFGEDNKPLSERHLELRGVEDDTRSIDDVVENLEHRNPNIMKIHPGIAPAPETEDVGEQSAFSGQTPNYFYDLKKQTDPQQEQGVNFKVEKPSQFSQEQRRSVLDVRSMEATEPSARNFGTIRRTSVSEVHQPIVRKSIAVPGGDPREGQDVQVTETVDNKVKQEETADGLVVTTEEKIVTVTKVVTVVRKSLVEPLPPPPLLPPIPEVPNPPKEPSEKLSMLSDNEGSVDPNQVAALGQTQPRLSQQANPSAEPNEQDQEAVPFKPRIKAIVHNNPEEDDRIVKQSAGERRNTQTVVPPSGGVAIEHTIYSHEYPGTQEHQPRHQERDHYDTDRVAAQIGQRRNTQVPAQLSGGHVVEHTIFNHTIENGAQDQPRHQERDHYDTDRVAAQIGQRRNTQVPVIPSGGVSFEHSFYNHIATNQPEEQARPQERDHYDTDRLASQIGQRRNTQVPVTPSGGLAIEHSTFNYSDTQPVVIEGVINATSVEESKPRHQERDHYDTDRVAAQIGQRRNTQVPAQLSGGHVVEHTIFNHTIENGAQDQPRHQERDHYDTDRVAAQIGQRRNTQVPVQLSGGHEIEHTIYNNTASSNLHDRDQYDNDLNFSKAGHRRNTQVPLPPTGGMGMEYIVDTHIVTNPQVTSVHREREQYDTDRQASQIGQRRQTHAQVPLSGGMAIEHSIYQNQAAPKAPSSLYSSNAGNDSSLYMSGTDGIQQPPTIATAVLPPEIPEPDEAFGAADYMLDHDYIERKRLQELQRQQGQPNPSVPIPNPPISPQQQDHTLIQPAYNHEQYNRHSADPSHQNGVHNPQDHIPVKQEVICRLGPSEEAQQDPPAVPTPGFIGQGEYLDGSGAPAPPRHHHNQNGDEEMIKVKERVMYNRSIDDQAPQEGGQDMIKVKERVLYNRGTHDATQEGEQDMIKVKERVLYNRGAHDPKQEGEQDMIKIKERVLYSKSNIDLASNSPAAPSIHSLLPSPLRVFRYLRHQPIVRELDLSQLKYPETRKYVQEEKSQALPQVSLAPTKHSDPDFKPMFYSIVPDLKESELHAEKRLEWRRCRYVHRPLKPLIWFSNQSALPEIKFPERLSLTATLPRLFEILCTTINISQFYLGGDVSKGFHSLALYDDSGERVQVHIDDFIPVSMSASTPVPAYISPVIQGDSYYFLPALLEKALAKVFGSYVLLHRAPLLSILSTLFGNSCTLISLQNPLSQDQIDTLLPKDSSTLYFLQPIFTPEHRPAGPVQVLRSGQTTFSFPSTPNQPMSLQSLSSQYLSIVCCPSPSQPVQTSVPLTLTPQLPALKITLTTPSSLILAMRVSSTLSDRSFNSLVHVELYQHMGTHFQPVYIASHSTSTLGSVNVGNVGAGEYHLHVKSSGYDVLCSSATGSMSLLNPLELIKSKLIALQSVPIPQPDTTVMTDISIQNAVTAGFRTFRIRNYGKIRGKEVLVQGIDPCEQFMVEINGVNSSPHLEKSLLSLTGSEEEFVRVYASKVGASVSKVELSAV